MIPAEVIKQAAQMRIEQVLASIGIHERARGSSIVMCNPVRGEKNPSLQIWVKPGYEGAWKDHGAGLQGDVFDLVAYFKGWYDEPDRGFTKTADFLADQLGLKTLDPAARQQLLTAQAARQTETVTVIRDKEEAARRAALALYLKGHVTLTGTPVDFYLRSRGIELARLTREPRAVRYLPHHRHLESGIELPCMIACMQDAGGVRAVHRTWLKPDGSGKADVEPQRKIWPAFTGSIIAIARGASGLPVKEANAAGIADTLVLTEGIEDALTVAQADGQPRVWAVGSLSNLAHVPVPDCASEIIVCVDNDWGNPRAAAMLERGLTYLATFKRPVIPVRSKLGKDVNDLKRGT